MGGINEKQKEAEVIQADNPRLHVLSVGAAILLTASLVAMPALGRKGFIPLYIAATLAWLLFVYTGRKTKNAARRTTILLALLLRLPLMFGPPLLSPDIHRYRWDGRVSLSRVNPYRHAPDDSALSELRDSNFSAIEHREIRSVYPPWAQLLFFGWVATGGHLLTWRLLLLATDLAVIFLLSKRAALAYATCPIVIVEGVWSGHLDANAGALLLASVLLLERRIIAGALLGIASGIKLVPLAAAPALMRRGGIRFVASFAVFIGTPAMFYAVTGGLMTGFGDYATRWSFHSPIYDLTRAVVGASGVDGPLKALWSSVKDPLRLETMSEIVYRNLHPDFITRALLAAVLAAGVILVLRRKPPVMTGALRCAGLLLLCSPTIHPWYWLTIVPLAFATGSAFWLALAAGSPLSYLAYGEAVPMPLIYVGSYLPALLIAAVQTISAFRDRDISRWIALRGESPS